MKILRVLLLISIVACGISCGVTRRIPRGDFLLARTDIKVDNRSDSTDIKVGRKELITSKDLAKYAQRPNKDLFGLNIPLWIYLQANPSRNNWWNNTKRKIGTPPVMLDTALTQNSAEMMKIYMDSKGYRHSEIDFSIDTSRKRARVTYTAVPGLPYVIDSVKYDFRDPVLRDIVLQDSSATLLHRGNLLDVVTLDRERVRIASYLKDRGYYNFSPNNITASVDTTVGKRRANITMVVNQYMAGYDSNGEPILENNWVYRIKNIYVYANYDPAKDAADPQYRQRLDTIQYSGLNIVYDTHLGIRPEVLRRVVSIDANHLYDAAREKRTYNNIMLLGYYRNARIQFVPVAQDTASNDNFVTYAFGDDRGDSLSYMQEAYLDCNIFCTPSKKQSYTIELEGNTTSDYFGITAKVGYQNRNIFNGAEVWDIGLRGGYEFMRAKGKNSSFEIGGSTSISFPRFITPFAINRYNRTYNPKTRLEISYNVQRRPYYHRTISGGVWGYSWGNGRNSTFALRPIDISIIKLGYIDPEFLADIKNPYLRESYQDQIIAGISGSYVFNNQLRNLNTNSVLLRVNFETNGNLINGLYNLIDGKTDTYHKLFGIRYAQYFRTDVSISRKFAIGDRSSIVYRLYGGWAHAYGNGVTIPFDRMFYCGGSNSMRGWLARTVGPGNEPRPEGDTYPRQIANMKLETNLEGRFPIWGIVHGALFFDLGNIWFTKQGDYDGEGTFRFNRFYKQLAFNTGLGVRLDFSLFVFRVDWGIQLHNPNNPAGNRWIRGLNVNNTTLNFGVGYPF